MKMNFYEKGSQKNTSKEVFVGSLSIFSLGIDYKPCAMLAYHKQG